MRIVALLSFLLVISFGLQAQVARNGDVNDKGETNINSEKVVSNTLPKGPIIFQTINIYPNPLPMSNPVLHIQPVGITIYGYQIVGSSGEIVEIENLIGRNDFDIVLLRSVGMGLYFITFTTNVGSITKVFTVV